MWNQECYWKQSKVQVKSGFHRLDLTVQSKHILTSQKAPLNRWLKLAFKDMANVVEQKAAGIVKSVLVFAAYHHELQSRSDRRQKMFWKTQSIALDFFTSKCLSSMHLQANQHKGKNNRHPGCRRYGCLKCGKRFDDLTGTIFSGHHQPLRVWMICLYLMGLNVSNGRQNKSREWMKAMIEQMTDLLRGGICKCW